MGFRTFQEFSLWCMYSIRVCVCVFVTSIQSRISLFACMWVGVQPSSSHSPRQQSDCLLALFSPPFSELPHSSLLVFFFFWRRCYRTCPPPPLLRRWVMHWYIINSFISIFPPLRCLCMYSSNYSADAHIIKQANIQNSLYDKSGDRVGGGNNTNTLGKFPT